MPATLPERLARIAAIETIAADALPSAEFAPLDGWRLRFHHGVTRRANSVLAERRGELPLPDKLAAVEAFYAERGLPTRFQLSPASQPPELDALLERRGYAAEPGALVQTCPPERIAPLAPRFEATIEQEPSPAWRALLASVDPAGATKAEARAAALEAAGRSPLHALMTCDGTPMAVGLGVLQGGALGLFNMATHPRQRRRGAAAAAVSALTEVARPTTLYLQVDARNLGAQAFYARLGFTTLYRYHYRWQGGAT
jgi:ribosomal protein S18 acetylase RimI-like enzyme